MAPTEYMSFEDFQKTTFAQAGLRAVYQVMKASAHAYPTEPWRTQAASFHMSRAFINAMIAHEDITAKDIMNQEKKPSTGCFKWQHALTRLFMVASKVDLPDLTAAFGPLLQQPAEEE